MSVNISKDAKTQAELAIKGLENVDAMGTARLGQLEAIIAAGGSPELSLEGAKEQAEQMKARLAAHKEKIAELKKLL